LFERHEQQKRSGKDYIRTQEQRKVNNDGRKIAALLQKNSSFGSDADLASCDLIIEAVFENENSKTRYRRKKDD
jgi:3-hydroxyacyl-CoA dehydrogenase/enoyl-CoA hydratase/3-hydroxybutyryl-CoA epimerase